MIFEGLPDVSAGNFGESKARPYIAEDIRFTTKGATIFAFTRGRPAQ